MTIKIGEQVSLKYRKAPQWSGETMLERFRQCRFLLCMHNLLTPSEANKVTRRILKLIDKENSK